MPIPPFNTYLGTRVVRAEDGSAEVSLELAAHHLNRRGVPHGGVITSLLDTALGAAVISSIPAEWWCATTSLSTQFVDGGRGGTLTATGNVVRRGAQVAFAAGEVRDSGGRILATAAGTWHLWPYRPGKPRALPPGSIVPRDGGRPLRVGKILAVGRNYAEHNVEMDAPPDSPPIFFLKPPSAIVGDGACIALPAGAGEIHHEIELVLVVGKRGKSIAEAVALDHVAGYAVGLDLTLRDLQGEAKRKGEPWSLSKGFDGSAPVSAFVPREDVGDGRDLAIRLEVNGELRQQGNTSQMLVSPARLISLISKWITLEPGDLIFTGTPSGVGPIGPGDRLEARIDGVGSLSVTTESEEF